MSSGISLALARLAHHPAPLRPQNDVAPSAALVVGRERAQISWQAAVHPHPRGLISPPQANNRASLPGKRILLFAAWRRRQAAHLT